MEAPSLPPGRYFRMLLIGYFEGNDSERGIVWRCSDSLSLREFLRLSSRNKVPDHSWMSKTPSRLPHEVHDKIFDWVLALVAGHDLVKGERIGVDGSTMKTDLTTVTPDPFVEPQGERRMRLMVQPEAGELDEHCSQSRIAGL